MTTNTLSLGIAGVIAMTAGTAFADRDPQVDPLPAQLATASFGVVDGDYNCRTATAAERAFVTDLLLNRNGRDARVMASVGRADGARTGLDIQYSLSTAAAADPAFVNALEIAAQTWENVAHDNATVIMDVDFTSGQGFIAATSRLEDNENYLTVRNALVADASGQESALVSTFPTSPALEFDYGNFIYRPDNPTDGVANRINFTLAQSQALGLGDRSPGNNPDSAIVFNTDFPFDNDPTDGLNPGAIDVVYVMIHELGHAMGFVSGTDGGGFPSTWDLYRVGAPGTSQDPSSLSDFPTVLRQMDQGDNAALDTVGQFPAVSAPSFRLSTGTSGSGDGRQASHWKDNSLLGLSTVIGVMDPTFDGSTIDTLDPLTSADLLAFSLFGWDIDIPGNTPPSDFALLSPTNNATGIDSETDLTFTWESSDFADDYQLRLLNLDTFNFVFDQSVGNTTSFDVAASNLEPGTDYTWQVIASNAFGSENSDADFFFSTADLAIPCPGDANGDNAVTPLDISIVLGAFGSTGDIPADVNGDGAVTPLDISEVLSNFGLTCTP